MAKAGVIIGFGPMLKHGVASLTPVFRLGAIAIIKQALAMTFLCKIEVSLKLLSKLANTIVDGKFKEFIDRTD
jgi:hypothetical protein